MKSRNFFTIAFVLFVILFVYQCNNGGFKGCNGGNTATASSVVSVTSQNEETCPSSEVEPQSVTIEQPAPVTQKSKKMVAKAEVVEQASVPVSDEEPVFETSKTFRVPVMFDEPVDGVIGTVEDSTLTIRWSTSVNGFQFYEKAGDTVQHYLVYGKWNQFQIKTGESLFEKDVVVSEVKRPEFHDQIQFK